MQNSLIYPQKRIKAASNDDVKTLLENTFETELGAPSFRNNVLIILFFCSYTTAADLSYYFGMPEKGFKSLHKELNDMERAGFIKTVSTGTKDAFSRVFYYLTDLGFTTAGAMLSSDLFDFSYKRRSKALTTLHDYSIGLNAVHLMLYGIPFKYDKEVSYSTSTSGIKKMGSLCVDSVCTFRDGRRIFIEEDLGHESTSILCSKLEKYFNYSLMDRPVSDCIVYSFRKPYICCEGKDYPYYSVKALNKLIAILKRDNITFTRLYEKARNGLLSSDIDDLLPVINGLSELMGLDNTDGSRADIPMSVLETFCKEIAELKSDFRVSSLNKKHEDFTKLRMRSMTGMLLKKVRDKQNYVPPYITALMKGFSAYCISTNLLSNYLPYLYLDQASLQYSLGSSLNRYFSNISITSYETVMSKRLIKDGTRYILNLKNTFTYDRGLLAIEFLSFDIGSVLRAHRFFEHYYGLTNICLLMVVDSISDAMFYSSSNILNCRENGLFICMKDLFKGDGIFKIKINGAIEYIK